MVGDAASGWDGAEEGQRGERGGGPRSGRDGRGGGLGSGGSVGPEVADSGGMRSISVLGLARMFYTGGPIYNFWKT